MNEQASIIPNGALSKRRRMRHTLRLMMMVSIMVIAFAVPAFASDATPDVATTLAASFTTMADTMVKTVFAALPAIMSVLSTFLCIQFGFKFFRKFTK